MPWECQTVHLQRREECGQWWAEVPVDAAGSGPLVGWEAILNYCAANGWELVSVFPLVYQRTKQGVEASVALAVFKRPLSPSDLKRRLRASVAAAQGSALSGT